MNTATLATLDGIRHTGTLHTDRYTRELAHLRPHDPPQRIAPGTVPGTWRIATAGHGYTAVPTTHTWNREARYLCAYGYQGDHATYLEEDCEAPQFAERVGKLEATHRENAVRVHVQAPCTKCGAVAHLSGVETCPTCTDEWLHARPR